MAVSTLNWSKWPPTANALRINLPSNSPKPLASRRLTVTIGELPQANVGTEAVIAETDGPRYPATILSDLVENVLAYARLERGSAQTRVQTVALADLLAHVRPRLVERAERPGLVIAADADDKARRVMISVGISAAEQILFNLVDNACKYAAPTSKAKMIHLEPLPQRGGFAILRVRNHGQGIDAKNARRLFSPFSKSAHQAAHTPPGVGLGLALCHRLSRDMGGDLQFDPLAQNGAAFLLFLRLGEAAPPQNT